MGWAKANTGENVVGLESQTWNIADGYTKIKILRLIIQLDLDEEIAKFGKKDDLDDVPDAEIPYKRTEAFDKMLFHLNQLIGNCKFAIEKGIDEMILLQLIGRINEVEKVDDGIASTVINAVTNEEQLTINEKHFKVCFDTLTEIKTELMFVLNRAGLIFRQGEELDLDAVMRSIEEGS